MSDELLTSIIQVIHERDLKVPEEKVVISFSNGYLPYYIHPKITFIKDAGYQVTQNQKNIHRATLEVDTKFKQ